MGKLSPERQAAKDQESFFVDCTIDGRYLPAAWEHWKMQSQTRGPVPKERAADILAIQIFLYGRKSLRECLEQAKKQLAKDKKFKKLVSDH